MNQKLLHTALCLSLITVLASCQRDDAENKGKQVSYAEAIKVSEENLGATGSNTLSDDACSHWDYSNTEWQNYGCSEWQECGGQAQTPVNIDRVVKSNTLQPIDFHWVNTRATIVNNGHTIQFNTDPGSYIISAGKRYDLLQFHYHTSSEHTINGKYFPMEVHYVHRAEDGKLAVVGIMFKKGHSNPLFSEFLSVIPHSEGTYSSSATINLNSLLPKDLDYYNYNGSLTIPPCSEVVNWHVLKGTVMASPQQLAELASIMHQNNRPLQPLNGRIITEFDSKK